MSFFYFLGLFYNPAISPLCSFISPFGSLQQWPLAMPASFQCMRCCVRLPVQYIATIIPSSRWVSNKRPRGWMRPSTWFHAVWFKKPNCSCLKMLENSLHVTVFFVCLFVFMSCLCKKMASFTCMTIHYWTQLTQLRCIILTNMKEGRIRYEEVRKQTH